MRKKTPSELLWIDKEKKVISCDETNKVLNENFSEVCSIIQNALDDAMLLGCDESDFKDKFKKLTENLKFSIGKR